MLDDLQVDMGAAVGAAEAVVAEVAEWLRCVPPVV
jgi:hypothetical protein